MTPIFDDRDAPGTPAVYAGDHPSFQQALPHSMMLEDDVVLLITPLRPPLAPALGRATLCPWGHVAGDTDEH